MRSCSLNLSLFFFKQKTAYEVRISDWSSDVCSSDLHRTLAGLAVRGDPFAMRRQLGLDLRRQLGLALAVDGTLQVGAGQIDIGEIDAAQVGAAQEIGRASCRERVCQYV